MKSSRRGFTVLLGFLVVLIFVFATIMAQTNEMLQLLHLQKQAFSNNKIKIETFEPVSTNAEQFETER